MSVATARQIAAERGFVAVEPYDDLDIAAGQGTLALELIEDAGPIDQLFAPVSGGGVMAGCAVAIRAACPSAEIIAVEPDAKPAFHRSMAEGERVAVPPPDTIADGLRVRVPGSLTWPIMRSLVDRTTLVSDAEMEDAMAWALSELRVVLEPSGATALAAALETGAAGLGSFRPEAMRILRCWPHCSEGCLRRLSLGVERVPRDPASG